MNVESRGFEKRYWDHTDEVLHKAKDGLADYEYQKGKAAKAAAAKAKKDEAAATFHEFLELFNLPENIKFTKAMLSKDSSKKGSKLDRKG